jgi:hypothetical protein
MCLQDALVLFHTTPGVSPLQEHSTRFAGVTSYAGSEGIRFEQEKYDEFLKMRTHGRQKWQMRKNTVQV